MGPSGSGQEPCALVYVRHLVRTLWPGELRTSRLLSGTQPDNGGGAAMAGAKGRGRGWAPLKAQTPQAEELARFLRQLLDTHGFTLRALQQAMSYGKSTISSNLDGRVPPEAFVVDLVQAVVKEPRKQALDLERARRLWRDADKPPTTPTASGTSGGGGVIALAHKAQDQLAEVYNHTLELERERAGSHHLVLLLVRLVGHLQDQVDHLSAVPHMQAEVEALKEQLRAAKQELERARQAREESELLASRAQRQAASLQEELAQLRAATTPTGTASPLTLSAEDLPPELQENYFLADVDRALRTAEGFLEEGAERRERLADDIGEAPEDQLVGEGWLILALLVGRTLGCVLMMVGAAVHYAVSTWVTQSEFWLGFPNLLVLFGIVLLIDPWDILWDTVRPWMLRIFTHVREPAVWPLDTREVISRVLRVPWGAAAATATVLSLATVYLWSPWILLATVPAGLGTMTYAVIGRNQHVVDVTAPVLSAGVAALRSLLPAEHPLHEAAATGQQQATTSRR